jgi:hypothetical protein
MHAFIWVEVEIVEKIIIVISINFLLSQCVTDLCWMLEVVCSALKCSWMDYLNSLFVSFSIPHTSLQFHP